MKIIVNVHLKNGVLDPQGKAVGHALAVMGFHEVTEVRVGKQIILEMNTTNKEEALSRAQEMTETLLANTVIEEYTIEVAQ
ncbi:MAG: phosphoribosylformylglycinamidine synthase subunit PurS [Campylobacterales bacterium]